MVSAPEGAERANMLVEEGRKLLDSILNGYIYAEHKVQAASSQARSNFEEAAAFFEADGNKRGLAEVYDDIGTLLRNDGFNDEQAPPFLLRAAALYGDIGETSDRLEVLLDLSELDPHHHEVNAAVNTAISEGLATDIPGEMDPLRLFAKLRDDGKFDEAMSLLGALDEEAERRDDKARMAKLLNERATTQDMWLKDRKGAMTSAERALEMAKASGNKDETLSALLMLADLHASRGARKRAKELLDEAAKIRGVRKSLRDLRKMMQTALA